MGFFSKQIGSAIGGGAGEVIDALGRAVDANVTTDEERIAANVTLEKARTILPALQVELNKLEAQSIPASLFNAWRPAVGWVCAGCLAYGWIGRDFMWWCLTIAMMINGTPLDEIPPPPTIDLTEVTGLIIAMLGMASIREYGKTKGTAGH